MKKTHILLIILVAGLIGAIMATFSDASTYADFDLARSNEGQQFTVVGYLDKEAPMNFDAQQTLFTFTAVDKSGKKSKVIYPQPKPQDFERSEEITMKGYHTDTAFVAEEILMKCPSKYNEQNKMAGNEDSYTE
ncbi:MAG: cytochrome c maturation protein CcmE [Bacteroidota bacterium]|nr:cytochrome c maturation protein CcmE [Bacteroidota bacterium]MDX5403884.1 cytochrome c maturation protein CcmE [Bacteroidota bacterium]MDX5428422.1 cytochrome c maturation protein CcmE [Bacteroidota bacterium]MDX5447060.1 cytochrome c maturation protein CcmE [Bacteroidota bacterium]MDX5506189.1 cytochrome c maturation protein CcmE [Bacteroidota bacterium]